MNLCVSAFPEKPVPALFAATRTLSVQNRSSNDSPPHSLAYASSYLMPYSASVSEMQSSTEPNRVAYLNKTQTSSYV